MRRGIGWRRRTHAGRDVCHVVELSLAVPHAVIQAAHLVRLVTRLLVSVAILLESRDTVRYLRTPQAGEQRPR